VRPFSPLTLRAGAGYTTQVLERTGIWAGRRRPGDAIVKVDKTTLLLAGMTTYVLVLAVLAIDQIFGPWLIVPELDRHLAAQIKLLASSNAVERQDAEKEIVSYHEFSIPLLIKTLKSGDPALQQPAARCLVGIAKKFFQRYSPADYDAFGTDPARWKNWWRATEERLDQAAANA